MLKPSEHGAPGQSGNQASSVAGVVVTIEGDSPSYFESGTGRTLSRQEFVAGINSRAGRRNAAPWVAAVGVAAALMLAGSPIPAVAAFAAAVVAAVILNWDCQRRRQTLVNYRLDQAEQSAFTALQDGLATLSRAGVVWRVEPDSVSFVSGRVPARVGSPQTPSIKASVPVPGITAGSETFHFFPDHLFIRTRRRYASISYADLKIEAKMVDVADPGWVPADTTTVGRTWRHTRRDGWRDRRYRDNPAIPIVRYALVILVAGQYRVALLVSGTQQAEAFASAIRTVAQRFAARPASARAAVPPVPVTRAPARQPKGLEPSRVSVPKVVGMTQAAATAAITRAGLVLGTGIVQSSSTVAAGNVITESPVAGTPVNVGSAVNLTVSSGPARVSVPDVVGMTQAAATAAIAGTGLVLRTEIAQSSSPVAAGNVINVSPVAGTSVNVGYAVNLTVSSGPAKVSVPDVVGMTQAAAIKTAITGHGLVRRKRIQLGTVTTQSSSTVAAGDVISQSPIRRLRFGLTWAVGTGALLARDRLLKLVEFPDASTFAERDAVALAQVLASAGFGVEPDVRFGGALPSRETRLYVFPMCPGAAASAPTQAYSAAALLIEMAALVSTADGPISAQEEAHLESDAAAAMPLAEDERLRFHAHLHWVLSERPGLTAVKKRIDALTLSQRGAICRFLVGRCWPRRTFGGTSQRGPIGRFLTGVEGYISPEEIEALGKLYRMFGLNPLWVYSHAHTVATESVTVEPAEEAVGGFAIPQPQEQRKTGGVQLDWELVERTRKETEAVSELLRPVFEEPAPPPVPQAKPGGRILGFDEDTSAFVRHLVTREVWSRGELERFANARALLLDGTLDAINEAALEAGDEAAWEGDDPVEVNVAVMAGLIERTVAS